MEGLAAQLQNFLHLLSPYAPLLVFTSSFFDMLFLTGYILYGGALFASVLMLYGSGAISVEILLATAYCGTVAGNCANFAAGKYFGHYEFIRRRLEHKFVERVKRTILSYGLFASMALGRFITFSRPVYGLFLGALNIPFQRFILYESIIALVWIGFWVTIITQGEKMLG